LAGSKHEEVDYICDVPAAAAAGTPCTAFDAAAAAAAAIELLRGHATPQELQDNTVQPLQ
jgi:hypothetical protein